MILERIEDACADVLPIMAGDIDNRERRLASITSNQKPKIFPRKFQVDSLPRRCMDFHLMHCSLCASIGIYIDDR